MKAIGYTTSHRLKSRSLTSGTSEREKKGKQEKPGSSHLHLCLPVFPVGLPVTTLKALQPSSNLAHLNFLNLITLTNGTNYKLCRSEAFAHNSTGHHLAIRIIHKIPRPVLGNGISGLINSFLQSLNEIIYNRIEKIVYRCHIHKINLATYLIFQSGNFYNSICR